MIRVPGRRPFAPLATLGRGFTLLEVLIAIAIFAVLAAMAYAGLNTILRSDQVTSAQAKRLAELQKAWSIIERDVGQIINRPVRDSFGEERDAISVGAPGSGFLIEFSRAGHGNPLGLQQSQVQRVGYRLADNQLIRFSWPQLDTAQSAQPREAALLSSVGQTSFGYVDEDGREQDTWPPVDFINTRQPGDPAPLPQAIRITMELEGVGELMRLIPLGVY